MFAYNPQTEDMSGQIIGQGMVGAAQTTANAQVKMADDIGGALVGLAGAFGDAGQLASQGDSAYEALGAIGEMYPGMKSTYGALGKMDPRTRRMASMSILDNLGAVSQLGIAGLNNQTRTAGQQIQQNAPYVAADIKNRQNVAGGNVPHGGGGGMAPVEPPLPPYSPAPVSQPPAPSANPASSIPGGDESMRRYNEWKSKRGS